MRSKRYELPDASALVELFIVESVGGLLTDELDDALESFEIDSSYFQASRSTRCDVACLLLLFVCEEEAFLRGHVDHPF